MNDTPPTGPEPANIRFLRRLVTVLTAVMILGMVTIVALFVMRYRAETSQKAGMALPGSIILPELPEGAQARAFTRGAGWIAVVVAHEGSGGREEILIFDQDGRKLRQRIAIIAGERP